MAEEKKALEIPRTDSFKIFTKLRGSMKDVETKLRTISFLEVVPEAECVNAAYIESRDIERSPYLFAIFKFRTDSIEALYTIPPSMAPKKRKLEMVRYFLNMLTALGSTYSTDPSIIYQLLDAALKEMNDYVSLDYNRLYTAYDQVKKDYEDISRRLKRTQEQNDALQRDNYELKTRNDELAVRIKNLETMGDEELKEKIQEWLFEHGGEINITEFSKVYKVSETRVEEMLNVLVREGYVQELH